MDLITLLQEPPKYNYELHWYDVAETIIISAEETQNKKSDKSCIYKLKTPLKNNKPETLLLVKNNAIVRILSEYTLENNLLRIIGDINPDYVGCSVATPKTWSVVHPSDLPESYYFRLTSAKIKLMDYMSKEQKAGLIRGVKEDNADPDSFVDQFVEDADLGRLANDNDMLKRKTLEILFMMPENHLAILPVSLIDKIEKEVNNVLDLNNGDEEETDIDPKK